MFLPSFWKIPSLPRKESSQQDVDFCDVRANTHTRFLVWKIYMTFIYNVYINVYDVCIL